MRKPSSEVIDLLVYVRGAGIVLLIIIWSLGALHFIGRGFDIIDVKVDASIIQSIPEEKQVKMLCSGDD